MDTKLSPLSTLALAISIIIALFVWQGNTGFSLWDEGFLWYGVQRVMLGEVPVLDFMSYDPGRYYWSAAIMSLLGDNGIMPLRAAVALFQVIGLFAGLMLIVRSQLKQNIVFILLSTIILVVWMFPRHKLFDISLSILSIAVLTFLVQKPTLRRYFVTGVCVGLVATFGRNHGIYAVAGSIGVMFFLNIKRKVGPGILKGSLGWGLGIVAGYIPILLMALLIPGFASAFWDSILFLFTVKATNLPLPIPWPWLVDYSSIPIGDAIRGVLVGVFFIATIMFGVLAIIWVVWLKYQNKHFKPALVGAAFLALPYAHYAYSRADVGHLAQGVFPLLIGSLVLLATQPRMIKWPMTIMLCMASVWVTHVAHPGWHCYISKKCVDVEISSNNLKIAPGTANDIRLIRTLAKQYAPHDQSFIATPFWPGAYAILERKSPMYEIYALFPRSQTFEKAEIERIKTANPGFAFVFDLPLDGRDELRFRNTHPLINQYILDNFEPLPRSSRSAYQIYTTKRESQ
ncbi:MAG: hypothetical protein COA36_01495 [Desulfotalea sp.]|nr:MAG: hypothetical protein COA36_01495 [Desulfotalea sp.]